MRRLRSFSTIVFISVAGFFGACSSSNVVVAPDVPPDASTQTLRQDANEIPCEPRHVLQTICQQCHTRPPRNGAPFSLVNRSDILDSRSGRIIRELMIEQLEVRRMPLAPVKISDESRTILLEWLRAGAPAVSPQTCPEPSSSKDAGVDADASDDAETGSDAGDIDSSADSSSDATPE